MGIPPEKERDIVIDIDINPNSGKETVNLDLLDSQVGKVVSFTVCSVVADDLPNSEIEESQLWSTKHVGGVSLDPVKNSKRDGRKSLNAKKPPKPPRPPRGLSLDAADQKLIKEISELAIIKRARIERMKALKKMKAGKSSTMSSSSSGSFIALLFTILFCLVIVFQGCHSPGAPQRNNSAIHIHESSESIGATFGDSSIVVEHHNSSSSYYGPLTSTGSPDLAKLVSNSDIEKESKQMSG